MTVHRYCRMRVRHQSGAAEAFEQGPRTGSQGSDRFPFITVDFMSHSDHAVSSYLMTMYAAMAVCTPGALASAQVTI